MSRVASLVAIVLWLAVPAAAQSFRPPDPTSRPWSTAQINLSIFYLTPTFELRGLGVDQNVFNDEVNPKKDLTGTLGLRSLVGLHFGDSLILQVTQDNSYIYFRRYRSERSIDSGLGAVLEYRTRVFRPWVRFGTTKTSQRAGVEIDARAERKTPNIDFGADYTGGFRLGLSVAARRSKLRYADTVLGEALNNQSDAYQGFLRYEISDLSDFIVGVDYLRDRFTNSPLRDNDSYYYYTGLRAKPGALFVGNATAGYKLQKHHDPSVPDFKGITATVDVGLVPNEFIRIDVNGGRDVGYSYQETYPYFVQQNVGGTLTNRFAQRFDVLASARSTWLRYDETMTGSRDPHTERTMVLGIGAGYFLGGGTGTRLGLLFERAQRVSPVPAHSYVTNRFSSSYRFSF